MVLAANHSCVLIVTRAKPERSRSRTPGLPRRDCFDSVQSFVPRWRWKNDTSDTAMKAPSRLHLRAPCWPVALTRMLATLDMTSRQAGEIPDEGAQSPTTGKPKTVPEFPVGIRGTDSSNNRKKPQAVRVRLTALLTAHKLLLLVNCAIPSRQIYGLAVKSRADGQR